MYIAMPFGHLFLLQHDMIKALVPLRIAGFQLRKGTALNKELLMIDGTKVYKLENRKFLVGKENGVYVVQKCM